MLLAVLMMSGAMFLGASMLAGIAELSFLGQAFAEGAGSSVSPVFGMLNVFITFGTDGFWQAAGYAFNNTPEVLGGVVNALVFNYAVLTTGEGILGGLTQMWVLLVVSGPILFYMFTAMLPWNTSG